MPVLKLQLDGEVLSVDVNADLRAAKDGDTWMVVDVSSVGGSTTEDGETVPIENTDIVISGFNTGHEAKLFIQKIRIAIQHLDVNVKAIRTRLKVLNEHVVKAQKLASECMGYAISSGEENVMSHVRADLNRFYEHLIDQHVILHKLFVDIGE